MTMTEWGDIANQGVAAVMFIAFISGLLRKWWVIGWTFQAMEEDRNYWRTVAMQQQETVGKAIEAPKPAPRRRTTNAASD